jgi:hypothetical protein
MTYLVLRPDAGQFKVAFDEAKEKNAAASRAQVSAVQASPEEPAKSEEEPVKPADGESAPEAADKEQGETTEANETPKD